MLRPAVDLVSANLAKDVDRLTAIRVLFDVEGEHDLAGHVPLPDVGMTLHFADAQ